MVYYAHITLRIIYVKNNWIYLHKHEIQENSRGKVPEYHAMKASGGMEQKFYSASTLHYIEVVCLTPQLCSRVLREVGG
jgi:hypothetical protein